MTINVENDAMLGRNNDSIYATKFYVMQKQIDDLQQENKQLKMINKEYERLDNGKPRGFVITRVDEYDIYDLLRYKENWNKLKMWLNNFHRLSGFEQWEIVNKMQELEQGSDNNDTNR